MADDTIQRIYQLIIDAGGSKAGADVFKQAAETIAGASQRAAGAAEPLQRTTAQVEQAMQRLTLRMDPAARAQANFARDAAVLREAFERQLIPMEQLQTKLQQLSAYHETGTTRAKGFGSAIQQAGFQVGDFAVQIASGQNPLRAFIQQGTQLISMFGPWGAIIGAAGAVVGALATSFLDLESATKKAQAAEEAHAKALEKSRDLYKEIRGEVEETKQLQLAQLRTIVEQAEAEYRAAQAKLAATPPMTRGAGRVPGTTNPEFKQAQAEVAAALAYVQQQRAILDAALDDYDARITKSFSAKPTEDRDSGTGGGGPAGKIKETTAAVKEQTAAITDLDSQLNQLLASMGLLAPGEAQIELAYEQGKISTEEYRKALEQLDAAQDKVAQSKPVQMVQQTAKAAKEATTATKDWSNAMTQLGATFTSAFEDAVIGGAKLSDVLKGLLDDLQRIALRMAENWILSQGGGDSGGGDLFGSILSGIGSVVSSWFSGSSWQTTSGNPHFSRAGGGPTSAGTLYRVNENGQEFFRPRVDGTVIPLGMSAAANSNGGTVVQIFDQRRSGADIDQESGTDENGRQFVRFFVRDEMKAQVKSGAMDGTFGSQYGSKRIPQKRRS